MRKCLCNQMGCTCLPDPADIELSPGDLVILGSSPILRNNESVHWITVKGWEIAREIARARFDRLPMRLTGFFKLYEILLKKTIHLHGQDEETRLWAVEQLIDVDERYQFALKRCRE